MTRILDKTEKGREEIATRKGGLAPRLRTLLVLIDGKHTEEVLLKQVVGLGLNEQSITELLDSGFITAHAVESAAKVSSPAKSGGAAAVPAGSGTAAEKPIVAPSPSATESNIPEGILPPGENQFQAIYNFYTSTIKTTMGLRGYALQLRVERAGTIEELCGLRQAYVEAVQKAKGNEMARSLRDRLDQLLYLGKPPSDLHPLI
jgi:hypothetical protein